MYDVEIAECRRRIALGDSLNSLLNHNPDFRAVVVQGFLRDAVLEQSLNINANKSGTVQFLKAAAVFKAYLDRTIADAEQARIDLTNYLQLIQDAR